MMEERTLLDEYGTDHGYDFRLDSRHLSCNHQRSHNKQFPTLRQTRPMRLSTLLLSFAFIFPAVRNTRMTALQFALIFQLRLEQARHPPTFFFVKTHTTASSIPRHLPCFLF